ncbi:unnamed protein product, partial [Ectocarpus sp. 6 AP-2014]
MSDAGTAAAPLPTCPWYFLYYTGPCGRNACLVVCSWQLSQHLTRRNNMPIYGWNQTHPSARNQTVTREWLWWCRKIWRFVSDHAIAFRSRKVMAILKAVLAVLTTTTRNGCFPL